MKIGCSLQSIMNNDTEVCVYGLSIYDTKRLFLTDLVNGSAYLQMYATELLHKIIKRKETCKMIRGWGGHDAEELRTMLHPLPIF